MNRQQKIAELKAQIAELEKITPEQRFLELIDGMTVKIDKDKYPGSIFFFKDDKCCLELENSILWVRYAEIWQVFEVEFGMKYDEIQSFIKDQMEQHFKMRGVTTVNLGLSLRCSMGQHFKMRGVTPVMGWSSPRPEMPQFPADRVEQHFNK
jgi:hypothetical protein